MPAINAPPYPRNYRLGGFRISNNTAIQWASRLKGRELDPVLNRYTVKRVIFDQVKASRINFRQVGEVAGVHWMLVTQSARFDGYKNMDPSDITQFEACKRDEIAQKFLEEAGMCNHY
jgi:hypothetical protein